MKQRVRLFWICRMFQSFAVVLAPLRWGFAVLFTPVAPPWGKIQHWFRVLDRWLRRSAETPLDFVGRLFTCTCRLSLSPASCVQVPICCAAQEDELGGRNTTKCTSSQNRSFSRYRVWRSSCRCKPFREDALLRSLFFFLGASSRLCPQHIEVLSLKV